MTRIVIVIAAYIAAQMLSDITSLKIALVAGLSIDAGTFIYPITFTLRDLVHKLLGKRAARTLIVAAAVIFGVGFLDDIREISAPAKVAGTVVAGLALAAIVVLSLQIRPLLEEKAELERQVPQLRAEVERQHAADQLLKLLIPRRKKGPEYPNGYQERTSPPVMARCRDRYMGSAASGARRGTVLPM